jgi:cation diffusion facilitator family transporter
MQMTPLQIPTRHAEGEDPLSRTERARTEALIAPLLSNALLVVAKLIVWLLSGSVSVLSEAVHSATDVFVTTIQLITVRLAARPADHDHAYGHGKFENVSAAIEAFFIMAVAAFVVWQAIAKLHAPAVPAHLEVGIGVMIASSVITCLVWLRLRKVADLEQSPALQAEAMQLQADVWTALGVAVGLAAIRFTGLDIIDPILSLLIAGLIVRSAYAVVAKAVIDLTDGRLPPDQEAHIREIIERHRAIFAGYHKLRTRRAGGGEFIDFHLQMRSDMPLKEAHDQSDTIVVDIKRELPRAHVLIHLEPEE